MKTMMKLLALITVIALLFTACGSKEDAPAPEVPAAEAKETQEAVSVELGLADWNLESSIWSSANGVSVDLTATPVAYADGMTATFVVRLEGEDVAKNPCQWDGKAFTSFADLNAEDGYCYYMILTGPDGVQTTVEINTPTTPFNEALINLAASLESFCHITVSDASYADDKLTIAEGSVTIQLPLLSGDVTCTAAELVLNLDGGALTQESLTDKLTKADSASGSYVADLAGISFDVPDMEDDHQLTLSLVTHLSDGTTLSDDNSAAWFFTDGTVSMTVG